MQVDIEDETTASEEVQAKLDAFRETIVNHLRNHGITLVSATADDLEAFAEDGLLLPHTGVRVVDDAEAL